MPIEQNTIRIDQNNVPHGINSEDGQMYYQVFSGQGYSSDGGNLERLCGALGQAEVKYLLDVYVTAPAGIINQEKTGLWLRKSDTDGSNHV